MKDLDKYRGCLLGGAIGDALGYAVEFIDEAAIFQRYGENGITQYDLVRGTAEISDDTQMTLFTAVSLLCAKAEAMRMGTPEDTVKHLAEGYIDWYGTQTNKKRSKPYSWLANVSGLYDLRAPGNTCLSAIRLMRQGIIGTVEEPINNSKGCGGVMRTAPCGLMYDGGVLAAQKVAQIGAEAAALTHGHPMGYIPGAMLAYIVQRVAHNDCISLKEIVEDSLNAMEDLFRGTAGMAKYRQLMEKAMALAEKDYDDLDCIHELGEGWVGDEALAIAVYCALKHADDFDAAMIASVNHKGDSDSTGAITGNILGAYLGMQAIPQKYRENLEMYDLILEIADDLYAEYRADDDIWNRKYTDATYCGRE